MPRSKGEPVQLANLALLLTVAVATPVRRAIDPKTVDVSTFKHVGFPSNGAVKQYPETARESQRGKFYIALKYKSNVKDKKWGEKRHLYRLKDKAPYSSRAEAEREVINHMLKLEGYKKEGNDYFESPAMVSARQKEEQQRAADATHQTLDCAAAATPSSSSTTTPTAPCRAALSCMMSCTVSTMMPSTPPAKRPADCSANPASNSS